MNYKYTLIKCSPDGAYSIALHYETKTAALKSMFDAVELGYQVTIMKYDVWRSKK